MGTTVTTPKQNSLASEIDINRFSKLQLLLNTTARVMKLFKRFKKDGIRHEVEVLPGDLVQAEELWIRKAQEQIHQEVNKTRYRKLQPKVENGIMVVGGRTERWMEATWNRKCFVLLPKEHRLSYLIALYEHNAIGHLGTESTIAKIRSKYWIVGIRKIVNSIVSKCVKCKRKFKRLAEQKMSTLPLERIKPSPAFQNVGIDYFGPYATRGEVQKRTRGKAYGIIFSCDVSRAVHLDIVPDYSTASFLQALRRFSSIRGWPQKIHSDRGSQLSAASAELRKVMKGLDWEEIQRYGHQQGNTWSFSPADAPWHNDSTEALVKNHQASSRRDYRGADFHLQ